MKAKSICALVVAVALGMAGCGNNAADKPKYQPISGQPVYETISGQPISLDHSDYGIAAVIDCNAKKILAYNGDSRTDNELKYVKAAALIESEISDGDKEAIELSGYYDDKGEFYFSRVKANGYQIDFKEAIK